MRDGWQHGLVHHALATSLAHLGHDTTVTVKEFHAARAVETEVVINTINKVSTAALSREAFPSLTHSEPPWAQGAPNRGPPRPNTGRGAASEFSSRCVSASA